MSEAMAWADRPTMDQLRARHAWETVEQHLIKAAANPKREAGQARKLPARVLTSGLGPALAFLEAKKEAPNLSRRLSEWVLGRVPTRSQHPSLLKAVCEESGWFLRLATAEALAYLVWLNRFAEAEGLVGKEVFD